MCNLSDGIEQRGIMKGIEKGIEKGKSEMILKMLQANHPIKVISEISDFSETKIKNIAKKHNTRLA